MKFTWPKSMKLLFSKFKKRKQHNSSETTEQITKSKISSAWSKSVNSLKKAKRNKKNSLSKSVLPVVKKASKQCKCKDLRSSSVSRKQ